MYAAQIYHCAKENIPELENKLSRGEFLELKEWLNEKIHKLGSLYASGDELMIAVTGKPLDPQVFLSYLKNKYYAIYNVKDELWDMVQQSDSAAERVHRVILLLRFHSVGLSSERFSYYVLV